MRDVKNSRSARDLRQGSCLSFLGCVAGEATPATLSTDINEV